MVSASCYIPLEAMLTSHGKSDNLESCKWSNYGLKTTKAQRKFMEKIKYYNTQSLAEDHLLQGLELAHESQCRGLFPVEKIINKPKKSSIIIPQKNRCIPSPQIATHDIAEQC